MRKIIGYIRNLTDGLGPPPGSVEVAAKPIATGFDIDAATDSTGTLSFEHAAGSGSDSLADNNGRFGWSMELSPGPINVEVVPHDPQLEYRRRFPDESAQVGMAYHSDIQRLGWAAGSDCLIWNAIVGGDDPAPASWLGDPNVTWNRGNGSIASFNADRSVTIRPFIGFLGGVLFSVESGNLVVPVGGSVAGVNASGQDRWDLLELVLNTDSLSTRYGQQTIQIRSGTPGAGIPASIPPSAIERRLTMHALKMAAGGTAYTQAHDLRTFRGATQPTIAPPHTDTFSQSASSDASVQDIPYGQISVASILNTGAAGSDLNLNPGRAYTGIAALHLQAQIRVDVGEPFNVAFSPNVVLRLGVRLITEGRGVGGGGAIPGTDYVNQAAGDYSLASTPASLIGTGYDQFGQPVYSLIQDASYMWMLGVIPAYDADSQVTATTRTWNLLRFQTFYSFNEILGQFYPQTNPVSFRLWKQTLTYNLWPV